MSNMRPSFKSSTSVDTTSSGKKSEMEELLISKGTPTFQDGIISMLFGINLALGTMSKGQTVLLDKIESIAQRVETLSKEVSSLKEEVTKDLLQTAMRLPEISSLPSNQEIEDWLNSPLPIPEPGVSMDLTCYETINPSSYLWNDPTWTFDGFMVNQESENPDSPILNFQTSTLKNQEPSGGTGTCSKRKLS